MNILVIPENSRNDQYILQPLFEQLFRSVGKPRARVRVCRNPVLGGVGEALKPARIREIVDQYDGMTDIFILCVDRDGNEGRRARLDDIETEFGNDRAFHAVNAVEGIETWVLAGLKLPRKWRWKDVRAAVHVKEQYFDPLANELGVADGPGGGRKALGEKASRNIGAIRRKCREDFDILAQRLEAAARKP